MTTRRLENWLSLSGAVALVFYFMHVVLGQASYPGYDWMAQAVSDLTALDAASYQVASGFASLYGTFSCVCSLVLCVLVRGRFNRPTRAGIYLYAAMNVVSHVGYTLFPLTGKGFRGEFGDIMHFYVVTLGVVALSIASLTCIGVGGLRKRGPKAIGILGLIALGSMFFGSIGMGAFPERYFGLFERFSVFSVVSYTAVLGLFGFSIPTRETSP